MTAPTDWLTEVLKLPSFYADKMPKGFLPEATVNKTNIKNFDVLLTVHLSIILTTDQLDTQILVL